jgi:CubicO group peptidase (beta-lactamase class C family)
VRHHLARVARLAAAIIALLGSRAPAQPPRAPLAGFDAYAEQARRDWRVPGMAVVVVHGDSVAFMKGFGVQQLGRPDTVGVHTRFGNMSTTKAFTAMLVAMLADSGRLAFDDRVTRHVPGLELYDPYVTRELTLRDLLTHRVGFPDPDYLWDGGNLTTFDDITHRLRWVQPASSFRSEFAYNNVAYGLAGRAAANAAGTTWQALLRRRILDPLGMTETLADGRELVAAHLPDVTAPPGIVDDTVRVLPADPAVVDPVAPAGSMFSTATDMAKWLRFLLDSGRVGGRRLVGAANFAQLFAPQQIVSEAEFYPTARLTKPHVRAYGMGWFLHDYRGEFVAFHTGSIEGRSAIVGLIPDRRLGVVVMTNLDHSELRHALMYTVFDRYIGPPTGAAHDWSAEMRRMYGALADSAAVRRRAAEARRIAGTRPSVPIERYAGTYADSLYGTMTIASTATGMTVRLGTYAGRLEHWQYDDFRVVWDDRFQGATRVSFGLDPDGSVGEVRFVGSPMRMRRAR